MGDLAVTAVGADQPGIIARVTGVLREAGGNLTDSAMTILAGQFAIMLLVEIDAEPSALQQRLQEATADLELEVVVRPIGAGAANIAPPTHILSVYGPDRPGIVHDVATVLADRGVNVTDLATRLLTGEADVYALQLEVSADDETAAQDLVRVLRDSVADVEVQVQPLDVAGL